MPGEGPGRPLPDRRGPGRRPGPVSRRRAGPGPRGQDSRAGRQVGPPQAHAGRRLRPDGRRAGPPRSVRAWRSSGGTPSEPGRRRDRQAGRRDRRRENAEIARRGEAKARSDVEVAREKLAGVEYGRTIQVAYQEWRDNNAIGSLALLDTTRADLRGWEWRYVNRLLHEELRSLKGHTETVRSVSGAPTARGSPPRALTGRRGSGTPGPGPRFSRSRGTPARDLGVLEPRRQPHGHREPGPDGKGLGREDRRRGPRPQGTPPGPLGVVEPRRLADRHRQSDKTARIWDARTGAETFALKGHTSA